MKEVCKCVVGVVVFVVVGWSVVLVVTVVAAVFVAGACGSGTACDLSKAEASRAIRSGMREVPSLPGQQKNGVDKSSATRGPVSSSRAVRHADLQR